MAGERWRREALLAGEVLTSGIGAFGTYLLSTSCFIFHFLTQILIEDRNHESMRESVGIYFLISVRCILYQFAL